MRPPRQYDSTIARITGNIAAGLVKNPQRVFDQNGDEVDWVTIECVRLAGAIVAEVKRTEPLEPQP